MRATNSLNKILIAISIMLIGLYIHKITSYRASDRYFYVTGVSTPEEFPISILGIWFYAPDGDFASASFYKEKDRINKFYSDWGVSEYKNANSPEFLPGSLFLEYIDFRSQNYYLDTIDLPIESMRDVFKEAEQKNHLKNLSAWNPMMGLEFHVGIANDGNLVFWLIGNNWEKEFYRLQLKPKPFPKAMKALVERIEIPDKDAYIKKLFKEISDSLQQELRARTNEVQYKDSIPIYFDNLQQ